MAEDTKIEWADHTFNPWIGCTKVGPGCDHCYAAAQDEFRSWTPEGWGAGKPRRRTSEANWHMPNRWDRIARKEGRRFRVFCASLADVFDNEVDPAWRADLLMLIRSTPHLDWLLLTKRIGNAMRMLQEAEELLKAQDRLDGWDWLHDWTCGTPPANVWLGATIVNQEEADRDIPKLLATPARLHFLSIEPMLGPISLRRFMGQGFGPAPMWVIAGGESGHSARPMNPDWARSLRDQCAAVDVPFLFKQWGEWGPAGDMEPYPGQAKATTARVFIDTDARGYRHEGATVIRFGKKTAGRLLDGVEHSGFPGVAHA